MNDVAKGKSVSINKLNQKQLTGLANKWVTEAGIVKLQNAVLVKDEIWKDMHNRSPFNPMGRTLAGILKLWRHLDLLVIGMAPRKDELDVKACLQYITHEVRCEWLVNKENTTRAHIYPVRFITGKGNFRMSGKPFFFDIKGDEPREALGGKRYFDLYNSKNAIGLKPVKL